MPTVLIDNREIEIPSGRRINGIEAAKLAGIEIPYYCWHPGLSVVGSCRMCLVEAGSRNPKTGKITMQPKLVPACNTWMMDNTVLVTQSEKVARARAMVEEGLLLRHPSTVRFATRPASASCRIITSCTVRASTGPIFIHSPVGGATSAT